jgi:putative hydrolase of the HAD superfamily
MGPSPSRFLKITGVRAVVFDAVGTLMRPEPAVGVAYAVVARHFGSARDELEVQARFRATWKAEEARDYGSGGLRTDEAHERRRWQRIVAEVFPEVVAQDELFAELWDHFADATHWRLFDDVAQAWRELAARGLVLAVASNFDRRLLGICQSLETLAGCPHVYASSLVGYRKPAAEFYEHVTAALRLPAESILMVGDDFENDVCGAVRAGWQGLLLSRERVVSEGAAIPSLQELLTVVREF